MIHNIAIKIVDSLSKYGSAQKKRDVYIYGTECFINETIGNFYYLALQYHYIRDGPYSYGSFLFCPSAFIWVVIMLPIIGYVWSSVHLLVLVVFFLTGFGIQ